MESGGSLIVHNILRACKKSNRFSRNTLSFGKTVTAGGRNFEIFERNGDQTASIGKELIDRL